MIRVAIIGNGNVASHLTNAFLKTTAVDVTQISSRNLKKLKEVDVTIIAVSDDAIADVSSKVDKGLVVHTSGSVSLDALQNKERKGVFYLLQSFTKDQEVDFSEIPFCLEAQNNEDLQLLESLATSIGKKIYHINSGQRKKLHLAAVFVNNFVNHLYQIGNTICDENNVPFEILRPLIEETSKKVQLISPKDAQTGPAKRNDQQTIVNHLEYLNEQQQEIYTLLTKSIQSPSSFER